MLIQCGLSKQELTGFFHIFSVPKLLVIVDEGCELLPTKQVVVIFDVVTGPLKLQHEINAALRLNQVVRLKQRIYARFALYMRWQNSKLINGPEQFLSIFIKKTWLC